MPLEKYMSLSWIDSSGWDERAQSRRLNIIISVRNDPECKFIAPMWDFNRKMCGNLQSICTHNRVERLSQVKIIMTLWITLPTRELTSSPPQLRLIYLFNVKTCKVNERLSELWCAGGSSASMLFKRVERLCKTWWKILISFHKYSHFSAAFKLLKSRWGKTSRSGVADKSVKKREGRRQWRRYGGDEKSRAGIERGSKSRKLINFFSPVLVIMLQSKLVSCYLFDNIFFSSPQRYERCLGNVKIFANGDDGLRFKVFGGRGNIIHLFKAR